MFVVVIAGILFALPNLFPAATMARMPAWLPAQAGQSRPRPAGRRPSPLSARREGDGRGLAQHHSRRRARDACARARIGYTDLAQNVANRSVSVKIRDAADLDKAYDELRKLAQPDRGQRVLRLLRLRHGCRHRTATRRHADRHRCRADAPHELRHSGARSRPSGAASMPSAPPSPASSAKGGTACSCRCLASRTSSV